MLKRLLLALLIGCHIFVGHAIAAPPTATMPSAKDKCPVCGMFVAKFPNWVASARLKDGSVYFFDGPKDLFSHYFATGKYTPGKKQADIVSLAVKEYYSLKMIDAKSALYVSGSNVYGPMGHELVPFATERDAAAFLKDHKGKRLLRFKEITPAIVNGLQ
jgi:nitrous oxide reductase accessory protein NosL